MQNHRIQIFLTAFLILFLEMTLIRWIPTQVRVTAYFPNLILIGAFLGIGVGALLSSSKRLQNHSISFILLLTIVAIALGNCIIYNNNQSEFLWLLYHDLPENAPKIHGIYWPLISIFILAALPFMPLGSRLANNLNKFRAEDKLLQGYCWDIAGSLFGVIAFSLISYYGIFPNYCLLLFGLLGVVLIETEKLRKISIALTLLVFLLVGSFERAEIYSPYYAIKIKEYADNFRAILVNGSQHQVFQTMQIAPDNQIKNAYDSKKQTIRIGYHRPYKYLPTPPQEVLIIGAGSGNDAAVALQNNTAHVDAVEIDPEIIKIGHELHPDQPYSSSKVTLINSDARSYINNTTKKYDLVVFATLDSMTKLSALSNVRLDNFIYTQECLVAVSRILKPAGGLVMHFSVHDIEIKNKLAKMLVNIFPDTYLLEKYYLMFNVTFLAGKVFSGLEQKDPEISKVNAELFNNLDLPSDDWPYLYLKAKSLSVFYLEIIFTILLLAAVAIYFVARLAGISRRDVLNPDWEMYLLGMGFLLFEGHTVVGMNLLWGATWITSAAVFSSILTTIFLSTLFTTKYNLSSNLVCSGIIATLAILYLLPLQSLLSLSWPLKLVISLLITGLPVFFSGIFFAQSFGHKDNADHALAWNLFGAVCGGLIEFISMITGLKFILLITMLIYLSASVLAKRIQKISLT